MSFKADKARVGFTALVAKNRDGAASFEPDPEGWIMVVPEGDFPGTVVGGDNDSTEIIQRFDRTALEAMLAKWKLDKAKPNFPGMLIDFDHFSHDVTKPSEAAGWIEDMELREDGLWGRARWSSLGKEKIAGGVYRLVSPVVEDMQDVAGQSINGLPVVRPCRVSRLALTNDPKLKGMPPVTNRNSGDKQMNFRELLMKLLGLAPEATDEDIALAVDSFAADRAKNSAGKTEMPPEKAVEMEALRNRNRVLASEIASVREEIKGLRAELIEADVKQFGPVFGDENKLRELLVKNRDATVATLRAVVEKQEDLESHPGASKTPLHSAKNRSTPGGKGGNADPAGAPELNEAEAAQVTIRAHEISARTGVGFNRAFSEALDEARRQKRAAAAKK